MLLRLLTHVDIQSLLTADKLLILSRRREKKKVQIKRTVIFSANDDANEMLVLLSLRDNQSERYCEGFVRMRFSVLRFSSKKWVLNSEMI